MALKFYGKIVGILPQRTGTSKSGKQWFSQTFLVEEVRDGGGEWSNVIPFTLMNKSLSEENIRHVFVGNDVTVSFNLNGKSWTDSKGLPAYGCDLQAWKVETGDMVSNGSSRGSGEAFSPVFAQAAGSNGGEPSVRGNQGVQHGNVIYPGAAPAGSDGSGEGNNQMPF